MPGTADQILQRMKAEQLRRMNLTKEALQAQYLDLEKENFPLDKRIAFAAD